jgi:hypothetical protein
MLGQCGAGGDAMLLDVDVVMVYHSSCNQHSDTYHPHLESRLQYMATPALIQRHVLGPNECSLNKSIKVSHTSVQSQAVKF